MLKYIVCTDNKNVLPRFRGGFDAWIERTKNRLAQEKNLFYKDEKYIRRLEHSAQLKKDEVVEISIYEDVLSVTPDEIEEFGDKRRVYYSYVFVNESELKTIDLKTLI
jgi:hypothetical protein